MCGVFPGGLAKGGELRIENVMDEHSRECLAICVSRKPKSDNAPEVFSDLFLQEGLPEYIRSDNGPEFTAGLLKKWLAGLGVKPACIDPGSSRENGFSESLKSGLRDEFPEADVFCAVREARVMSEAWRRHCNHVRPHSALGYAPTVPSANVRHEVCLAAQAS